MRKAIIIFILLALITGIFTSCIENKNNELVSDTDNLSITDQSEILQNTTVSDQSNVSESSNGISECDLSSENQSLPEDSNISSEESIGDIFKYATTKYSGTTIKILTYSPNIDKLSVLQFVADDECTSDAVNTAVMERNAFIYANYGITIETVDSVSPINEICESAYNTVLASTNDYDLICGPSIKMVDYSVYGLFVPLDDYININDVWWNQASLEGNTLDENVHFFVSGDFMLTDVDYVNLILFNKRMYNENNEIVSKYGNIYDLVRSNRFTLDAFIEMSKAASKPDSDGKWSLDATYGLLSYADATSAMVSGCDTPFITISGNNIECYSSEKALNSFQKIYDLMTDSKVVKRAEVIVGENWSWNNNGLDELQEMFINGHGLFYNTTVSNIAEIRNLAGDNFEFGVLPMCLYNEDQNGYYSLVSDKSTLMAIINSNNCNKEAAAFLLNALGYWNIHLDNGVMDAYYKSVLGDDENSDDLEMLEIVIDSRYYDIGYQYSFGDSLLINFYPSIIRLNEGFCPISKYESIRDIIMEDINETYENYEEMISTFNN
ncbi:MAG: hypothetical protein PHW77_09065 [Eubacteriales bacterium]|nr:hypothetical protein [Eubacteriales bacterium]